MLAIWGARLFTENKKYFSFYFILSKEQIGLLGGMASWDHGWYDSVLNPAIVPGPKDWSCEVGSLAGQQTQAVFRDRCVFIFVDARLCPDKDL